MVDLDIPRSRVSSAIRRMREGYKNVRSGLTYCSPCELKAMSLICYVKARMSPVIKRKPTGDQSRCACLQIFCMIFVQFLSCLRKESPRDKRKSTDFGAHQRFWDQRYNELSHIIDAEGVYSLEQR